MLLLVVEFCNGALVTISGLGYGSVYFAESGNWQNFCWIYFAIHTRSELHPFFSGYNALFVTLAARQTQLRGCV